jgi:hypothetical protein
MLLCNDYEVFCDSNVISKYDSVQCLSVLRNSDAAIEMQFFSYSVKRLFAPSWSW